MAFMDKYKIAAIPVMRRTSRTQQTPEQRARQRMLNALEVQQELLQAEIAGKTYTITRNGKQMQPRAFWMDTPAGLVFTPRFGNEFLFDKGQGVMVKDRSELIDLLKDFGTAVTAGEFDMRIMEIAQGRGGRAQGGGGRRGRPRKQPQD